MADFGFFLGLVAVQVIALGFDHEDLSAGCHGDDVGVGVGGAVDHEALTRDVAVPPLDIGQRKQHPGHQAFISFSLVCRDLGMTEVAFLGGDRGGQHIIWHATQLPLFPPELEQLRLMGLQKSFDLLFHLDDIGIDLTADWHPAFPLSLIFS